MADAPLDFGRQLAEALLVSVWNEDWIVAETVLSARGERDAPLASPHRSMSDARRRIGYRNHTNEARAPLPVIGAREFREKSCGAFSVARACASVSRREYAGRAAQGIDFKAGIICQRPEACLRRIASRLQSAILRERRTRLLNSHYPWKLHQAMQTQGQSRQQYLQFTNLARVVRGDQQFHRNRLDHKAELTTKAQRH